MKLNNSLVSTQEGTGLLPYLVVFSPQDESGCLDGLGKGLYVLSLLSILILGQLIHNCQHNHSAMIMTGISTHVILAAGGL